MIIHSPIISGSLTFAEGATFTLPDNGVYSGSFSGSAQFSQVSSHIIPDTANTYDLGSATNFFRDLYISTGSLKGMGSGGNVVFKFAGKDGGGLKVTDDNDNEVEIQAKEITLKDTSGNGNNIKLKVENGALKSKKVNNSDVEQAEEPASELSGSFTGSVQDLIGNGDATFNDAVTVSGLSSLDGGINVADNLTVDASGNTVVGGTLDSTGLASLDGGIDVDGAFTVADGTGNVSTTGTLAAGNTTITGTVDASGLSSLDGGIDVGGAFTVATTSGNVATTGTLSAGATTLTSTVDVTGLASLDGGIDVDGAFTVADASGNVSTTGTLNADGNTTLGGTLGVTGNSTLSGTLGVTGATTLSSTLAVTGNTTLSGTLSAGATTVSGLTLGATEITATGTELNILDGVTATTSELNILDGVTATAAELNILDGVTATATEINALDGITVDATKLNYLSDMTGNVKAYIDTEVAGVVDTAPEALNTLNELAAALGDDPNFATTISAQIGGKVSQSLALTAGNGLTGGGDLTQDRTFNVAGTLNRISVSADAVDIASTYVGQTSITTLGTIGTGTWQGDAIAHDYIGLDAIDGTNIADDAINSEHIVDGSIDRVHLAADIVDGTKIADDSINSEHIVDGSIDNVHLAGSIAASKITEISNLTADEGAQLENINSVTISNTQWGYLGAMNQGVTTSSNVTFGNITGGAISATSVSATGDVVAYASSDERLKDNIELIPDALGKVKQLRGVTWDWNDNADELQKSLPNVGVIAQDVENILPQLVKDRDNGYKGVDYDKIVGLLIEAIKEQDRIAVGMGHQINDLQSQIDELKSKLS